MEDDLVSAPPEPPVTRGDVVAFSESDSREQGRRKLLELRGLREERAAVEQELTALEKLEELKTTYADKHGDLAHEVHQSQRDYERCAHHAAREGETLRMAVDKLRRFQDQADRVAVAGGTAEQMEMSLERAGATLDAVERQFLAEIERVNRMRLIRQAGEGTYGAEGGVMVSGWRNLQEGIAFMLPLGVFLVIAAILVLTALGHL